MPVVGHAVAGLALAALSDDAQPTVGPQPFGPRALLLVGLAYVPDIAAQLGMSAGLISAQVVSHSLIFAAVFAVVTGPVVARMTRLSLVQALALSLSSVVLHDAMDIAQSPGRMPFWPAHVVVDIGTWIPSSLRGEALVCLPFLLAAFAYQWRRKALQSPSRRDWASLTAVVLVVAAAAVASELRDRRERDLIRARALAESGQYQAALDACAVADRWPSTAAPGRIDYVRAMSWWGLGRDEMAEELYLRSYGADPGYIWAVADLAALYASSSAPIEERTRNAERWLTVLRERFPGHPALPQLIARVQGRLERTR